MKDSLKDLISTQRSAVMGVAAIWIACFHLLLVPERFKVFKYFESVGFAGVDFFFLLSGMGLVYAIEKYKPLSFYERRLERVFLPYAVTAAVISCLEGWEFHYFVKNLLGISFYVKKVTSFLWFVPAILTLYLFSLCIIVSFTEQGLNRGLHWHLCWYGWHCQNWLLRFQP